MKANERLIYKGANKINKIIDANQKKKKNRHVSCFSWKRAREHQKQKTKIKQLFQIVNLSITLLRPLFAKCYLKAY